MNRRVWEVCEPHSDVFARDMDLSMFAASLHAVDAGTADRDYTEPERFFARTFMTRSLEDVLERVLARLLGQPGRGAPILRLETPFGGGKTHTMVALYHAARHPEAVEGTGAGGRILERLELQNLPRGIQVAVLDGVGLDPNGRTVDGLHIRTLWGELAYRLGRKPLYEAVRASDEARTPPGQDRLADLLRSARPALILMDEVMHYLAKARAVRVGETSLSAQSLAFLRELTAAVAESAQTVLVLALPASALEVPAEDQARAEELFQSVRKVVGRVELVETPVAQDEIFGVLKQRLFRSVGDDRTARRAVEAFTDYYENFARFFPEGIRSPQYRERMREAYPFHPELVDLLVQRWGPHPQFQRTRGALRLLALVLRRLWNQRPGSAYLIQPHHIDLVDRHIRAEVVRLLDGAFEAIIAGDILGRAREIDRELGGEYRREQLAEGAATGALLYSISSGAERQGCNEEELRVALLRPEINPAQVSEVLGRLRSGLWFLRYRDHRYFFTARPNLNKVILDFEQSIPDERVDESLHDHLLQVAGPARSELQVLVAPGDAEAVGEPSRATLVLLPLRLSDPDEARAWMARVVGRVTSRNLLVFLAPEKTHEGALRVAVRRWLALQNLQKSRTLQEMDREDQDAVREQARDKESEIQALLFSTYQRMFRPAPDGVTEVRAILKRDGKTLAEAVAATLKEKGLLIEALSPTYLAEVFRVRERPVSLAEVQTVLAGSPDHPIVADPRPALQEAIRAGVTQGQFAVRAGGEVFTEHVPEEVLARPDLVLLPQEAARPVEAPAPAAVGAVLRVAGSGKNLYPISKLLEQLQGKEASMEIIVRDSSGVLTQRRDELERLLNDYGVSHEWD